MRVLFLCNSKFWGGAERYVQAVAEALAQRGHDVYGAAPPQSPLFTRLATSAEVTPLALELGPKLAARTAIDLVGRWPLYTHTLRRWLTEHHQKLRIELLHVQFKKEQLLATGAARRLGIPVLWTEHGALPGPLARFRPALWLYRRMASKASAIICVSEAVKRDLIARGVPTSLLRVCRNGIHLSEIPSPPVRDARRQRVRESLGIGKGELVVAAVGRLSWVKGLCYLIEAVPSVLQRVDATRILVVGDGPELAHLVKLAAARGVSDQIIFTGHRDDIDDVLAATDVVVMPSLNEGMPFAALEAMVAGVPVVASRVGALPELLDEGRAGILVQPGKPRELASGLCEILVDADKRTRLAKAGRARVVEHFSFEAMIDCSEAVMREHSAGTW